MLLSKELALGFCLLGLFLGLKLLEMLANEANIVRLLLYWLRVDLIVNLGDLLVQTELILLNRLLCVALHNLGLGLNQRTLLLIFDVDGDLHLTVAQFSILGRLSLLLVLWKEGMDLFLQLLDRTHRVDLLNELLLLPL